MDTARCVLTHRSRCLRRGTRRQGTRRRGAWIVRESAAQSTLEYALTVFALMAIVSCLALLWRAGESGALARLVEGACSHALDGLGFIDIALF